MGDFPEGARVRIGQCEGTVKGMHVRVKVQFPGVGEPGYFDPKFVHLVDQPEPVVDADPRRLRAERDTARALVTRLVLATTGSWFGWDDPNHDPLIVAEGAVRIAQERLVKISEARDANEQMRHLLGCIWLYVDWRYVTKQLTTEQKELWADAVDDFGDPDDNPRSKVDRWWRLSTPDEPDPEQAMERPCGAVGFWGARNTRYECDKPKGHPEKEHENSSEEPSVIWFGDHAAAPATPTEPRVWRTGDAMPPTDVRVTDRNGRSWAHCEKDIWCAVDGALVHLHLHWPRLAEERGPLSEVVEAPGGAT